ncbi:Heavy metal translocating P-type ATPase [Microbacterium sp. C448]|uniref:heavy metal translocating P-type ATPase n=1 Tax=Microbacterium sp. C448 TaxID=1177594 RepID=UPI0003DE36C6|nr:heavy metal translocating P-type ATPase [Microbacterium sp. C448]CDK01771.1 Heavy metal translocating P-type ATPase [Microbacterium sp. C448]
MKTARGTGEAESVEPSAGSTGDERRSRTVLSLARGFPWVVATLAVAAVAGVLQLTPWTAAATGLIAAFVLVMAARSAWSMLVKIRHGAFGVDIIAVTAIVAAVLVGEFWAALVVVLMLTTGDALEAYAANRAQRDLTALLSRRPQIAHRVRADGEIEDVPVDDIAAGERILVRTGEVVPVDGILAEAAGSFDESSLTGESLPVDRTVGETVMSGAVNGSSAVVLEVERVAMDSQYQQIIALVEGAASSKAPMVRLADRFALPFALVAYSIAGLAWALSGDPVRFAEVLVVATPCPLIIAAPVAFMAGMSRAAREGIIIRTSATLEKLFRTRNVAFDKTGTLTRGEPTLVDIRPASGEDSTDLLRLAAAVEANSTHTLAAATLAGAHAAGVRAPASEDAREVTAHGVTATVEGNVVAVGKRTFIADHISAEVSRTDLAPGEMAIYVAIGGHYGGALVFRDEVRPEAAAMLRALRALGVRNTMMLTGDDRQTAEPVAASLGISEVHANCLPAEKVSVVAAAIPRPVVMVGDGINDAPVLAVADVGMAMGARGATAASEAADVVILRDDVGRVATTIAIGRETVGIALQSIWIGLSLSVILMLLAAFGLIPAIVGAWLQEGIDVIVILWALRATR